MLHCVAIRCSMLQRVAVICSVLQCVAVIVPASLVVMSRSACKSRTSVLYCVPPWGRNPPRGLQERFGSPSVSHGYVYMYTYILYHLYGYVYIYIYTYSRMCMGYCTCGCEERHTYEYIMWKGRSMPCKLQCVAVCCSVRQCVAVCCNMLRCVASKLQERCGSPSKSPMDQTCHV